MMSLLVTSPDTPVLRQFLDEETRQLLETHFAVRYNPLGRNYTPDELREQARGVDILLTHWGTPSLVQAGLTGPDSSVKLLAHAAGSIGDLVDPSAFDSGLRAISGNTMFAESTAEGTLAYMLAGLRHIPAQVQRMHTKGYWRAEGEYSSRGLFGRDIGIIGVGAVATALMRMLKPFRPKLRVYDTYPVDPALLAEVGAEQVALDTLLQNSTVVSLHLSLTEHSRGLIGKEQLQKLPEGALLVNTSRGPILREDELCEVLQTGRIRAFLDVYTVEPLAADSPLRSMDNVCLMPHCAGPTKDLYGQIGRAVVEDILRFARGEPLRLEITAEQAGRMTKERK